MDCHVGGVNEKIGEEFGSYFSGGEN